MWVPNPPRFMYQIPFPQNHIHTIPEACQLIRSHLFEAVRKRLMADVPVGVFLSGGLDSSLIAAIVRSLTAGPIHSFAVGLEGSEDLRNARQVAQTLHTEHHEKIITPTEIIDGLPTIIQILESYDPSLVRSAIPTFYVAQLAAQYVKVVLSGEGADELFAGYHYLQKYEADSWDLSRELYHITKHLYHLNLQRVDRLTMYHGLEARVPFLDISLLEAAFSISNQLKRHPSEKWILRKVAESFLPKDIVWRKKEKFAIGTGIGPFLENLAQNQVIRQKFGVNLPKEKPNRQIQERRLYWSYFKPHYDRPDILALQGHSRSLNPNELLEQGL